MIALSGFILIFIFGTPGGGSRPIIPSLVPIFGIKFGLIFAIFQIGYCYYFNIKKGFLLILCIWGIIVPFIYLGEAFRYNVLALCGFARVVTGASCASAIALGICVFRGKL